MGDVGPTGPDGALGPTGPQGDVGPTGAQGADGQLRIYGDGTAGPLVVAAPGGDLDAIVAADGNMNYTDVTIDAGGVLTVPSGTVIRCTGTFTNNGTILVGPGARGATGFTASASVPANVLVPRYRAAGVGLSGVPAGQAEIVDLNEPAAGGASNDTPMTPLQARAVVHPGVAPAGGGGGSISNTDGYGGEGGGSLVVLCRTAIVNGVSGAIVLNGNPGGTMGGGGGGGGVLVLASPGSITNDGALAADGGIGGDSAQNAGAGGGGGGGIVHTITPAGVVDSGFITASPGAPGISGAPASVSDAIRSGGGAGGDGAGDGGDGGGVSAADDPLPAESGTVGHVLDTQADPTPLF
jgi:hypothetical protein